MTAARPAAKGELRVFLTLDTLQPQFYMSLLVLGSQVKAQWGSPEPPLGSRFQYSLLDDPDVVRFVGEPAFVLHVVGAVKASSGQWWNPPMTIRFVR